MSKNRADIEVGVDEQKRREKCMFVFRQELSADMFQVSDSQLFGFRAPV